MEKKSDCLLFYDLEDKEREFAFFHEMGHIILIIMILLIMINSELGVLHLVEEKTLKD